MSGSDRDRGGGGGDRDRPRTGTLFEPSLSSSFGGASHDPAAFSKRGGAGSAPDRRADRGIAPGAAPASLPMARNDAAAAASSANHGGFNSKQHGKKGQRDAQQQPQHNQQQQHHSAQSKKGGAGGAKPLPFVMPTRILAKPTEAPQLNGASVSAVPAVAENAAVAARPAAAAVPAPPVVIKTAGGLPALLYHRPVELFDSRGTLVGSDALMSLLSDSAATPSSSSASAPAPFPCDFTVFGAVGTQFSGRSTVLNALARPHSSAPHNAASAAASASNAPRDPTFLGQDSTRPDGFDVASHDQMLHATSAATGIQVLVTPERNILVDTPPLDAASTLASMIGKEAGSSSAALPASATAAEIAFQLQTLQTMLLLLGSCHVLLVTCESHTLLPMCRLLQRALLLRQHLSLDTHFFSSRAAAASPSTASPHSTAFHGLPDIVFILNKQPFRELCHPQAGSALSESSVISAFFREQPFRKNGAVSTFGPPPPMPRSGSASTVASNAAVNCFHLPFCSETAAGVASSTSQLSLALQELSFQLLTLPKLPASARASERDWLRHITRSWQSLQSAPVLAEWRAALQKATPRPLPIAVAGKRAPKLRDRDHVKKTAPAAAAAAKDAHSASASSSSVAASSSASSSHPMHPPRGPKKPQHQQSQQQSQSSRAEAAQHDRGVQPSRKLYEPPGA